MRMESGTQFIFRGRSYCRDQAISRSAKSLMKTKGKYVWDGPANPDEWTSMIIGRLARNRYVSADVRRQIAVKMALKNCASPKSQAISVLLALKLALDDDEASAIFEKVANGARVKERFPLMIEPTRKKKSREVVERWPNWAARPSGDFANLGEGIERASALREQIVSAARAVTPICGIYFLVSSGEIVYVGQSVNILVRLGAHIKEKEFDSIAYLPAEAHELDFVESYFIHALRPRLNGSAPYSLERLLSVLRTKEADSRESGHPVLS